MNNYSQTKYITQDRWNNYWYQIRSVKFFGEEKSILEIGVGNKIVSDCLKKMGFQIKTLDINPSLFPDCVASVENIPLSDKSFDAVLAAEVLEHLPFDKFEKCLSEIRRVAKNGAIISLPHSGYTFSFSFKIPLIKWKHIIFKIPHFWRIKTSTNEHYWEIGLRGYSRVKIKKAMESSGFKIEKYFIAHDDPSHIFFILSL